MQKKLMSQDLVSSRAGLKHALGDAAKLKWSKMKPHATVIMEDCLTGWPDKESILNDEFRWVPPVVTADLERSCRNAKAAKPVSALSAAGIWAASMNSQWFKKCDGLKQLLISKDLNVVNIAFSIGAEPPSSGDRNSSLQS